MSERNRQHTLDIFSKHKGEMVISNKRVYQFIGIAHDPDDFLYILYDGRKIHYSTILCRITILKGKIDDDDYNEMIRIAKLNWYSSNELWGNKPDNEHYEAIVEGCKNHKEAIEHSIKKNTTLLSDIVWDFN